VNPWLAACVVLTALLLPVLWLGARGSEVRRLIGLQMFGQIVVLIGMAFSRAVRQPSYLIVPLALAILSVTGILVYTRLLSPRPEEQT